MAKIKTIQNRHYQVLMGMWSKWNSYTPLVECKLILITLDNCLAILSKAEHIHIFDSVPSAVSTCLLMYTDGHQKTRTRIFILALL